MFLGLITTHDLVVAPAARLMGGWAQEHALAFFGPMLASSGILLLWLALSQVSHAPHARRERIATRLAVAALLLLFVPPFVGYASDRHAHFEGSFAMFFGLFFGSEPAICLLVCALVLGLKHPRAE